MQVIDEKVNFDIQANPDQESDSAKENLVESKIKLLNLSNKHEAGLQVEEKINSTAENKPVSSEAKAVWSSTEICMLNTPADGSCLFYALIVGSLLPLVADKAKFQQRYIKLFDRNDYSTDILPFHIEALLKHFEKRDFQRIYSFLDQNQLTIFFRLNLVGYMREEIARNPQVEFNDVYSGADKIVKTIDQELKEMEESSKWGGTRECAAFGAYLGGMTVIPLITTSGSILAPTISGLQAVTKEVIYVVHTPASTSGTVNNHYQLLLPRALIERKIKRLMI